MDISRGVASGGATMRGTVDREAPRAPDSSSTVAIVTTFHPEAGLIYRLATILPQVGRVLIIDNGSEASEQAEVRAMVDLGEVDALWNDANLGLAMALDQGLQWAEERGADWALLLDQDSHPTLGIVAEASRVIAAAEGGLVAAVGAGMVAGGTDGRPDRDGWRETPVVITSGTLVSVSAWKVIGGFRRDFFVDYVDLEFCLRARGAGYRILQSMQPTIRHSIGRPERRRLLWRTVTTTHHDGRRRYSITRNRVVVWRTYWRREARFVSADLLRFVKEFVKAALFESDRRGKLRAVASGLRDGLLAPRRSR